MIGHRRLLRLLIALVAGLCAVHAWQPVCAAPPSFVRAMKSPPRRKLETVVVVPERAPVAFGEKVRAAVGKGRMFGVLRRDGDRLEIQVCFGTEIHRGWIHTRHVRFLMDDDVDLGVEALTMAKALNPELDIGAYKTRLDALAKRLAAAGARGKTARDKARLIGAELFGREGFAFADGISRLDRVLDLRMGNCVGLSLLYLSAARKLDLPLHLVGAPTHAFVRYDDGRERFNVETTKRKLHDTDDYLVPFLGRDLARQAGGIDLMSLPDPRALGLLLRECGIWLAHAGRHAEACRRFARAIEINPRYATAYDNWGLSLARMGNLAAAREKYASAVAINPRHAEAYSNWGLALAAMKKPAAACTKFAKAVEINPRHAGAYNNWSVALLEMGKHAQACEKSAKAVELDPRHANGYYNWGCALTDMGRHADAAAKFAKAAELDPHNPKTYCNWGLALACTGQHAKAAEKFAKAVELRPRYAKAFANWGLALARMGKLSDGIDKLNKAAELDPKLRPQLEKLREQIEAKD